MRLSSLLLGFLLTATPARGAVQPVPWAMKPYRVLLVVEHWNDPTSVVVEHGKDTFQPVAALLKAWSVPFDILRLDQQHFDASYLFGRAGDVRYGALIWLADPGSYTEQNLASLEQAVHAGTSLLVCRSRFLDPALERILGLKFRETYTATDPLQASEPHYITRELTNQKMDSLDEAWDFSVRFWVEPQGAKVLIDQHHHPVVTVNQSEPETSAIWMGVPELAAIRDSAYWRGLFFRSLVWSLGYMVTPSLDFPHLVALDMDDWGTADKGFLSYWHYQTPTEETLGQELIAPLQQHGAVAAANINTGYVNRKSQRIESPWTQQFTDLFGIKQDYASTQRGLKNAIAAGVLEVESHGWTHMEPDLESPPGPWWSEDLAGEASADGWYREFEGYHRGTEIPAIVQLAHLKRSIEYLQADFGHTPLSFRPGGGGWSRSYANNTPRLAAQLGFGLFHAEPESYYYLDRDLVLDMMGIGPETGAKFDRPLQAERWPAHPDGPVFLNFHDRDISLQPGFLNRLFAALPGGYHTLSMNEYIAMLHAGISSPIGAAGNWQIVFDFDQLYCAYFANHSSRWRLWLSDPLRERLEAVPEFSIAMDGKPVGRLKPADLRAPLVVDVPPGVGSHVFKLSPVSR
jgi:peptidoglycan/xylan/chitin deacetylase (PgdA/CDA1 family)